ncbi:MAG: acyl carrier protein [Chromatiaceae bacterium]|jgi:acyl carrier protein
MTRDEIQSVTLEILGQIAPDADLDNLDPTQSFRDQFEFDSVDYLNFVLELEKQLEIKIPEIECPRLASLNGCTAYLTKKLGA